MRKLQGHSANLPVVPAGYSRKDQRARLTQERTRCANLSGGFEIEKIEEGTDPGQLPNPWKDNVFESIKLKNVSVAASQTRTVF